MVYLKLTRLQFVCATMLLAIGIRLDAASNSIGKPSVSLWRDRLSMAGWGIGTGFCSWTAFHVAEKFLFTKTDEEMAANSRFRWLKIGAGVGGTVLGSGYRWYTIRQRDERHKQQKAKPQQEKAKTLEILVHFPPVGLPNQSASLVAEVRVT